MSVSSRNCDLAGEGLGRCGLRNVRIASGLSLPVLRRYYTRGEDIGQRFVPWFQENLDELLNAKLERQRIIPLVAGRIKIAYSLENRTPLYIT